MRAVLEYLVDNLSLRYEDLTTEFRAINVNAMYTDIIGYDDEDIFYAVYNLWQAGYIEANVKMSYTIVRDFDIWNVSYEGQQFYQNIHKSSVWERTKQVANKAGSVAISILSSIAQNIIMQEIAGLIAQQ
jgi:hypothetical protein